MKTLYTLCDCLSYYGLTTITDAKRWRNTKSLITKLHKEFQCCVHREEIPPSTFTATLFPNQLEQRPDKYEDKNSARAKLTISPTFFRCALPVDLKPINDWQSKIVPPRATKKNRVFFRYTKILTLQFLFEIVIPPEFSRLQIVIIVYLRSVLFRWHDDETRQYFLTTFCMLQYNSDYF